MPDSPEHRRTVNVIGIDCAADPDNVGLARGRYHEGMMAVQEVRQGSADMTGTIIAWAIRGPTLFAMDAPLGWPAPFGQALATHEAGGALPIGLPFERETDRVVHRVIGRKPLDVGADRIARTARSALRLLHGLRDELAHPVPLAWDPDIQGARAIEVYPAGTLKAHGLPHSGYKRPEQAAERAEILDGLAGELSLGPELRAQVATHDQLDAIVCLLAARDFLNGDALPPEDDEMARKEGWIWVKRPA